MPRRLGQHFLKDRKALRKIAAALEINSRDTIVEVGPGHGELTEFLLRASPKKIIAVEKDKKLVSQFQASVVGSKSSMVQVIEGDVLKILPKLSPYYLLPATSYKLCGNIPYYLTGYLFRKISELAQKPRLIVFTIQREVAERICAPPPKMNLLAASVQFWGRPKIIGYISKKSFRPPPKVDSAIIKIVPHNRVQAGEKAKRYYKLIKILFEQPRKTVLNNLRAGLNIPQGEITKELEKLRINGASRPQNLALTQIRQISHVFAPLKKL